MIFTGVRGFLNNSWPRRKYFFLFVYNSLYFVVLDCSFLGQSDSSPSTYDQTVLSR